MRKKFHVETSARAYYNKQTNKRKKGEIEILMIRMMKKIKRIKMLEIANMRNGGV
jgi:hypothetical protein